jgi:dihydropteroate synthase
MHMQGEPRTMQGAPQYDDVVDEVAPTCSSASRVCEAAGIARDRLLLDPGFGFGKTWNTISHCCAVWIEFAGSELPLLVGLVAQVDARHRHRPTGQGASASVAPR